MAVLPGLVSIFSPSRVDRDSKGLTRPAGRKWGFPGHGVATARAESLAMLQDADILHDLWRSGASRVSANPLERRHVAL